MNDVNVLLMHTVLRECAAADPDPWHPKSSDLSLDELKPAVERLRQDGFLVRLRSEKLAFTLSDAGFRLLDQPEEWQRYRDRVEAELNDPQLRQRRAVIRASLTDNATPILSRWLLWLNLIVFGYGIYLCSEKNVKYRDFLIGIGRANVGPVLIADGALTLDDVMHKKWQRLITACFVHVGLLHLLMNGYAIHVLGRDGENLWGAWRFLLIYLTSGIGGSCLGIYERPDAIHAGASGALCGLVAAEAIWLFGNRRYLPRGLFSRQLWNLISVGLMIGLLSLLPFVSGAGHLGGAVAGAAVAILLHAQRFTRRLILKILLLPLVLALPVGFVVALDRKIDRAPYEKKLWARNMDEARRHHRAMLLLYRDQLGPPLLRRAPDARDPEKIKRAIEAIDRQVGEITAFRERLAKSQSEFRTGNRGGKTEILMQRLDNWILLLTAIKERLVEERPWSQQNERTWRRGSRL